MKTKICVFTLGCKVNLYDSDAMLEIFREAGFDIAEGLEFADVYVINTCAVTAEAEKKSRQAVARIKKINPVADIFVCGCASQNNAAQFEKDGVKYIIGTEGKLRLASEIAKKYSEEAANASEFFNTDSDFIISNEFEDNSGVVNLRTRHFIKVQDGCNNFCSYCIVPYLRGRCRSRSIESVVRELDRVGDGVKEAVVSGVNLSAYGVDCGLTLTDLICALSKYPFRIRLGSLEVNVINEKFLSALKNLRNFCPHFHLSLQSGDDGVLRDMNRRYTTDQYFKAVGLIREYFEDPAITTDIIVGFPTETDIQFENTVRFAREVGFADIHVFPYSSRKGTVAGKLKTLPPEVVDDRQRRLTAVKRELERKYLETQIGRPLDVIFETCSDGMWVGHAKNYVKVYCDFGERNEEATVIPTAINKDGLIAKTAF